jgi:hypothetical protein
VYMCISGLSPSISRLCYSGARCDGRVSRLRRTEQDFGFLDAWLRDAK